MRRNSIIRLEMEFDDLDAIDLKLLKALQEDASISNQDLAYRVHVAPSTNLRRVRRLHELGLIERQVTILDPTRLAVLIGHGISAIVEVSLDRQEVEQLDAFASGYVEACCLPWRTRRDDISPINTHPISHSRSSGR